mgnify:CR=1 FL=1
MYKRQIQDWSSDLGWVQVLDSIFTGIGYGILPVLAWYLIELCLLAAVGCASIWIVTHHVLCVALVLYLMAPAVQCVDLLFFRVGWILMMHALLEQPQFTALLLHRLDAVKRMDLVFIAACIYSVIHRGALLILTFYFYVQLCWQRSVYTEWVVFHRYFLPPVILLLFVMQSYPVFVYWTLYKQHVSRQKSLKADDEAAAIANSYELKSVQALSDPAAEDPKSGPKRSELSIGIGSIGASNSQHVDADAVNTSSLSDSGQDQQDEKELQNVSMVYTHLPIGPPVSVSRDFSCVESPRSAPQLDSPQESNRPAFEFMPPGVIGALPGLSPRPVHHHPVSALRPFNRTISRRRANSVSLPPEDANKSKSDVERTSTNGTSVSEGQWDSIETRKRMNSRLHEPRKYVEGWATVWSCAAMGLSAVLFAMLVLSKPADCSVASIQSNQHVGIVGGGVSGLVAAWRLAEAGYKVTVFEQSSRWGGAASVYRPNGGNSTSALPTDRAYDMGMKLWPPATYPNFEHLLQQLNETSSLNTGTALLSFPHAQIEPAVGNGSGLANLSSVPGRSLHEDEDAPWAAQLARLSSALAAVQESYGELQMMTEPVSVFATKFHLSSDFVNRHLAPCLSASLSVGGSAVLNAPVAVLLTANRLFGLCTARGRVGTRTFANGADSYVDKLISKLRGLGVNLRLNTKVDQVRAKGAMAQSAGIVLADGEQHSYDHVIVTGRLQDWGQLERETSDDLKKHLFGQMGVSSPGHAPYARTMAIAHNYSAALQPAQWNGSCWQGEMVHVHTFTNSSRTVLNWHHPSDTARGVNKCAAIPTTGVPPIGVLYADADAETNFIPSANQLETRSYRVPVPTANYMRVGRNLHKVQGRDRIWYAGVDAASMNVHEAAVASGLAVARELGGSYPFAKEPHASAMFLAVHQWMMFGVNYFVHPLAAK